MSHDHVIEVPKPLLIAAGALVAVALAAAAPARTTGAGAASTPAAVAAEEATLQFRDEPGGGVLVLDAATGAAVARYAPGEGGFVRIAMRALARARLRAGLGPEAPVRLLRTDSGRLVLEDPSTGDTVELAAFGRDNRAAFADLLQRGRTAG